MEMYVNSVSDERVMLSVCLITYNHANYIRQALNGILGQDTQYSFEILVHDDASTDGTVEVLREYEAAYPGIIRVFYETENQYGKYSSYFAQLLVPMARGKYIALCEGDDCWTDNNKIQIQVTYLEHNIKCAQICHSANVFDADSGKLLGVMGYGEKECDLTTNDLIEHWNIPTASRVLRKSSIDGFSKDWSERYPVGDFPTAIYSSLSGYMHYIPKVMSSYRYRCRGSWTEKIAGSETAMRNNALAWIKMLNYIDRRTNNQFHKSIMKLTALYVDILYICSGGRDRLHKLDALCLEAYGSQPYLKRVETWLRGILWRVGLAVERNRFGNRRIRVFRHA